MANNTFCILIVNVLTDGHCITMTEDTKALFVFVFAISHYTFQAVFGVFSFEILKTDQQIFQKC